MGILNWFKIVKNKKIHEAILEIAVNTHSPFCPKLVDYSACVPPALQNGFVNSFDFDNFELHKHSYTQFWSQTLLDFFSLWATLATLGGKGLLEFMIMAHTVIIFRKKQTAALDQNKGHCVQKKHAVVSEIAKILFLWLVEKAYYYHTNIRLTNLICFM